jgi:hypothetical protein
VTWGGTPIPAADVSLAIRLASGPDSVLLYDFVRPQQYRLRDREAEGLGGLEVDDQLELRGLLDGGHGRPRADTLERIARLGSVSMDWLLRGDRCPPEVPREWDDAVRLLRAAWREPSRRELVRRVLRALGK